jgi:hypothetical protein
MRSRSGFALTRRSFLRGIAIAPVLGSRDSPASARTQDPLDVLPLDALSLVNTTTGRYLAGELLIRNTGSTAANVVEVRLGNRPSDAPAFRFAGADLQSRLAKADAGNVPLTSPTLGPGEAAILFLWDPVPAKVEIHSAAVDVASGPGREPRTIALSFSSPLIEPVIVQPPLAGGPWVALYDPQMPRGHRRVAFIRGQRQVVPARFAIDWVRLDSSGRTSHGAPNEFDRWLGFGADVFAVADARVVGARDSYPDVLTPERPAKWIDDDVSGNYVGLEVEPGRVAFYEHLQRGSVRVKTGDSVRAGQPIAKLGRSGVNSTGPHLHFHLGTDASTIDSQGRPYGLSQFQIEGVYQTMAASLSGVRWPPADPSATRNVTKVLPAPATVVTFEGS